MLEIARANQSQASNTPWKSNSDSLRPCWVWAIAAVGAVLLGAGGVIALAHPAMLASPHDEINGAVRIYAGYVAARDLGLAIMLIAAMILRARGPLHMMMLLIALIQILDVLIDLQEGRYVLVLGVLVLALLFFAGAARLSGYPFWKAGAWKLAN
jgi:hypothetical protein